MTNASAEKQLVYIYIMCIVFRPGHRLFRRLSFFRFTPLYKYYIVHNHWWQYFFSCSWCLVPDGQIVKGMAKVSRCVVVVNNHDDDNDGQLSSWLTLHTVSNLQPGAHLTFTPPSASLAKYSLSFLASMFDCFEGYKAHLANNRHQIRQNIWHQMFNKTPLTLSCKI